MSIEKPSLNGLPTIAEPTSAMEVIELGFGDLDSQSILDIGCGKGALAAALIERGATVTGLDPNEIALEEAKTAAPGAEFHVLSGAELPYEDGSFDGAIFLNSLHHIPEADMGNGACRSRARLRSRHDGGRRRAGRGRLLLLRRAAA